MSRMALPPATPQTTGGKLNQRCLSYNFLLSVNIYMYCKGSSEAISEFIEIIGNKFS
jgi:hypothetical protein